MMLVRSDRVGQFDLLKAKTFVDSGELCSAHASRVVIALESANYVEFFRLYDASPKMSAYLLDFLVHRVRDQAYDRMVTAYRPSLSISFLQGRLAFSDEEETKQYLKRANAQFIGELSDAIDCKLSLQRRDKSR